MKVSLRKKLDEISIKHNEIQNLLSDKDIINDMDKYKNLSVEYAKLEVIIKDYKKYLINEESLQESEEISTNETGELKKLADEEIKSAKEELMSLEPEQLSRVGNGYSGCWVDADYGSVSQKWLLVHSEQAAKREVATFYKNLDKNITKELKALGQLIKKKFLMRSEKKKIFFLNMEGDVTKKLVFLYGEKMILNLKH